MQRPVRGQLYPLDIEGSWLPLGLTPPLADGAMVISSDEWNAKAKTCTIVPIYEGSVYEPHHVDLNGTHHADPRRVAAVPQRGVVVRDPWGAATPEEMDAALAGVREHLCIDQLLARQPSPQRPMGTFGPSQGSVRFVKEFEGTSEHPYVVVSHDVHNATSEYLTVVPCTSQDKSYLADFEVVVLDGVAIIPNVAETPVTGFPTARPRTGPAQLTPAEMAQIASVMANSFGL